MEGHGRHEDVYGHQQDENSSEGSVYEDRYIIEQLVASDQTTSDPNTQNTVPPTTPNDGYEVIDSDAFTKKEDSTKMVVTENGLSMTFDEIAAYLAKDDIRVAPPSSTEEKPPLNEQLKKGENQEGVESIWPMDDRKLPSLKDSIWNQRFQEIMALPETGNAS